MSAPDTNVEKQERHHKPALFGIKGVLILVALLIIGAIFYTSVSRTETGAQDIPVAPATTEPAAAAEPTDTVAPAPASEPGTNQSPTMTTD